MFCVYNFWKFCLMIFFCFVYDSLSLAIQWKLRVTWFLHLLTFTTKTHLKSGFSSPSSGIHTLHEQTATPVIINSRHLASLSRHFPASVLSQEPREESTPLSLALREDKTSQLTLERRQFDEDEKFEQQLLQSAGLWNLLTSPLTAEKQLPTVISPLEDAEPPCDACALFVYLIFSFAINISVLWMLVIALPCPYQKRESKSLLERRAKNRSTPKPNSLDSEVYVPQKTNAKKKMKQGFDTDDALQLFLWGPATKQLLTANEETELITHIQHLIKLEKVKAKLESQNGCEPPLGEWAEAMGLSGPPLKSEIHRGRSSRERLITANLRLVVHIAKQYQNRGLNFQDLLLEGSMGLMKSWWIRQSIRKSIFQNSRTIRLPIARVPTWVPSRVPGSPGGKIKKMNSQTENVNIGNGSTNSSSEKEELPLWNYVTKLEKLGATGGTWRFKKSCISPIVASFGGVPFNLARNPSYHRSYQFAAASKLDGYVPPSYNKLRTTLLQQEKNNVEKLLVPLKSTWKERGVTIVSDGWSDPVRKPLINFLATSGSGHMFLKAENCFGEVKDKFFIAKLLEEVIHQVGDQNVVQVITDNAPNCKAAGDLIEGRFPHIYWTPCIVHTLNLALKNICAARNVEANQETYEELAIFGEFCPLRSLKVADTRFASIIVMLKRLKLIKRGLQVMVISEEWSTYRDDDIGKASFVKEKIVDDGWWEKILRHRQAKSSLGIRDVGSYDRKDLARKGPHRDSENFHERIKCFRRLFPSNEDHMKVMEEYALFSMKSAFKLLGQPSSSSCAECNWSTYSFIHSLRKNMLNSSRAQQLVFIHNNLRHLSRNSHQYEAEKTKMWDVGRDGFDSTENVGFLEFADLSLDEPDFKNELLDD
ncbi:unnamed protein product [Brassica napus]|uniref:(rape) hypothetical protein n=1 Tax=Brassica napus TaxID=3708 RepID=A0A816I217_BRANA|nr:unnamed protein product [Brassica napus]